MEIWKAAVLGMVQGITEFLPVSSSGHIILFEKLLCLPPGGMFFGVMLHAGTLLAVLFAYFPKIEAIVKGERKMLLYLAAATLPAAAAGFFFGDRIDALFFGGKYLWAFFALTAALLLAAQRRAKRARILRPVGWRTAWTAGFAQALAVVPGLSRSGVTVSACLLAGTEREKAADFSFLMSIPIIAGAIFAELLKALTDPAVCAVPSWQSLAVGSLSAAVCGFAALRFAAGSVKRGNLYGYAVYLIALSLVLLCFASL